MSKIAFCQLSVTTDNLRNIPHVGEAIEEAANKGAQLVLLPVNLLIHPFDIDILGKMTFKESKMLTMGENPTIVDTDRWMLIFTFCSTVVCSHIFTSSMIPAQDMWHGDILHWLDILHGLAVPWSNSGFTRRTFN